MKLSVIIPAYNEESVIQNTLDEVLTYLQLKFTNNFELIVVDDGSGDNTSVIVVKYDQVTLIRQKNTGKGGAVRTGVLASQGEWILFMDADNSTRIKELDEFTRNMNGADIIIGSRAIVGSKIDVKQPWIKSLFGRIGNVLIQMVLLPGIKDSRCGFKLYSNKVKDIFRAQKLNSWAFDDEILFLAMKKGMKIKELPVTWVNNFDTTVKPLDYLTTIFDLFRVRFNYFRGAYKFLK